MKAKEFDRKFDSGKNSNGNQSERGAATTHWLR